MDRVKDKVVIVTGGALGLGRSACLLLAREGAKVVVTDVKEREGTEVVTLVKTAGGEAVFMAQDAGSETDWERVIRDTVKKYKRVDAIVNNAGLGIGGNAEDTTLEDWRKLMQAGKESSSQALGRAAVGNGASGLLVRSAAVSSGINVAVFPHVHRDDRMKVVEGEKLARLGVRLRA